MRKGRLKKKLWISIFSPFLLCNFFNAVGRGTAFPSHLLVFLAGLSDVRQINRRTKNIHKSLITCIHRRDLGKLSSRPKRMEICMLNTIEVEIVRQSV